MSTFKNQLMEQINFYKSESVKLGRQAQEKEDAGDLMTACLLRQYSEGYVRGVSRLQNKLDSLSN